MTNIWDKIKAFFSRIWQGLTWAGRIIIGIILLGIIILTIYSLSNTKKDDAEDNDNKDPEVAQVYEPSIGSPLPATTTPSDSGAVAGASTSTATTESGTGSATSTAATNNDEKPTNIMIAPAAGIDPNEPIDYESQALHFSAILPALSVVNESQKDKVIFSAESGKLIYIVSANDAGTETLSSIQNQLANSPSTTNLKNVSFNSQTALSFQSKEYGFGVVFISKGKVYYLLGDNKYFTDFKAL